MDFADIHTIIIGEEGEYGRRLVRYLENHGFIAHKLFQ